MKRINEDFFIIGVVVVVVAFVLLIISLEIENYHKRELQSKERILRLERDIELYQDALTSQYEVFSHE